MKIRFYLLLLLLLSMACGSERSSENVRSESATAENSAVNPSAVPKTASVSTQVSLDKAETNQEAPRTIERKIIRNADLVLQVSSPEETLPKISSMVENKKGFVVETNQVTRVLEVEQKKAVTMTVRVPAEKFEETLTEIRQLAITVVSENVKGQDVTEEFIDIEARLKTQKALEAQFLEILKRATTVGETLEVQSKIADVRNEIEKIEGRKRFLENQSSFSTIKLQIQPPNYLSPNSAGFFYKLREAVSNGFSGAMGFILFLIQAGITLLPFFLFIVLPIYWLIRYFLKKRRLNKTAVSAVSAVPEKVD